MLSLLLRMRRLVQRPLVVLPLAVFGLYALYLSFARYRVQYYDAYYYVEVSKHFVVDHHFSLLYFDTALRGYFWPLVLLTYRGTLKAIHLQRAEMIPMGMGLAAALWGWALPALWRAVQTDTDPRPPGVSAPPAALAPPVTATTWRHVVLVGLGFVLWRGYFAFALTDLPGLLALITALVVIFGKGTGTGARHQSAGWALVVGALVAAAANIRPIFLLNAGLLLVAAGWEWVRTYGARGAAARLLLFGLGAALVLAPQWRINRHQFGASTPLVLGRLDNAADCSLYLDQLSWGLGTQRYETSIEPSRPAQMFFADPSGQAIADAEHLVSQPGVPCVGFQTTSQALGVFRRHWLTLVPLYARHVFNGLDQHQPTPYLGRLGLSAFPLMALNYTVWFALLLVLWRGRLNQRLHQRRTLLVLAVLLAPCAAVVPTAIEPRFLLPAHLLAYIVLAYGWPTTWTLRAGWAHRWRWPVLVAYVGWLWGCFALAADVYSQLRGWPRLFELLLG